MKTLFRQFLSELEANEQSFDPKLAYHDSLNPALWHPQGYSQSDPTDKHSWILIPEVEAALNRIGDEFIEFLGVDLASVTDVILTGSNANFNWTDISDIDLHIILDMKNGQICPTCPSDDFITDCFQSKKTLWNTSHHITIHGFDVELYAQNANENYVSDSGVYSLRSMSWLQEPQFKQITIDNQAVKLKSQDIITQIDTLINSQSDDLGDLNEIKDRIKKLRSSGLQKGGEFSIENLAFKAIRNLGYLNRLNTYIQQLEDLDLSI